MKDVKGVEWGRLVLAFVVAGDGLSEFVKLSVALIVFRQRLSFMRTRVTQAICCCRGQRPGVALA